MTARLPGNGRWAGSGSGALTERRKRRRLGARLCAAVEATRWLRLTGLVVLELGKLLADIHQSRLGGAQRFGVPKGRTDLPGSSVVALNTYSSTTMRELDGDSRKHLNVRVR